MIFYYLVFILLGLVSFYVKENHKKEFKKHERQPTNFDHWDFLLWKIGILIGFCGVIGIIIELIKYLLDY